MKHIYYIDVEDYCGEAASVGVIGVNNAKITIIPTGTTIRIMNSNQKSESNGLYEKLAQNFYINFIFDDTIPDASFYAVPRIDIFATDSFGGYWATIGGITDISNEKDPIYFIDNKRHVFLISENLRSFIYPLETIGERIKKKTLINNITFYESKNDAKEAIHIHDIAEMYDKTDCKLI